MRVSSRVEPLICKSNEDYLMKARMQNESMRLDRPDSRVEPKVMAGLQTFMGISEQGLTSFTCPKEGLLEFIAGLKKQGKKLAVVSSTSTRLIVVALNRMKMLGLFDVVVCGDMCRNRKPDPECYRKAMQYLEAKPEECIAIEDSFIGIQAAKAANIEVVAYTGAGENQDVSQADYVISSYV